MRRDETNKKTHSAALIDGIKGKALIDVGDSIVRKSSPTDARLNKDEGVVVCLPGARIKQVTEGIDRANHWT